jgi:hypothetical protein
MELTERLIGRSPPEDWMIVYDLSDDASRLRAMQETSLAARTDAGLDPNPLVGSAEWIAEIHDGRRPIHTVTGMIGRVYWGSMADYAEFTIVASDQSESNWAREGDSRLYVPEIAVELFYVEHAWKKDLRHRISDHSKIKLAIWLERSPHRSSAIAPGPGGAGYELARREGGSCTTCFPGRPHSPASRDGPNSHRCASARGRRASSRPVVRPLLVSQR